jgi:protein TonB
MPQRSFQLPTPRRELALSILLGVTFASVLFLLMALAQMLGEATVPENEIVETLVAYTPPEIEEIEEEAPPPPEEEEAPPELEAAPPMLSLAQLDIALNPGTGGSLAGDFQMPTISTSAAALGTEDFVDFSELDQTPRPINGNRCLKLPRRLSRKKAKGTVNLMLTIDETGRVLDAEVGSSNLPDFENFYVGAVQNCTFSPPTRQGQPVQVRGLFPLTVHIQ